MKSSFNCHQKSRFLGVATLRQFLCTPNTLSLSPANQVYEKDELLCVDNKMSIRALATQLLINEFLVNATRLIN